MIIAKIQQLTMLQIENLRIPFSEEEEQLIASIPSYVNKIKSVFFGFLVIPLQPISSLL